MLTKLFLTLLLAVLASLEAGCYYTHLASGQLRMLLARRDVGDLIADPETPENLRQHTENLDLFWGHAWMRPEVDWPQHTAAIRSGPRGG